MRDPERWQQIESILDRVLDEPPEERAALLDELCAGSSALRRQVEKVLSAGEQRTREDLRGGRLAALLDGLDVAPPGAAAGTDGNEGPEPQQVGPYRILRPIGRGGMGQVYLALRHDEEFKRHVALKVIRRGIDTDDILRRFRTERQILASLQHPNIAQLLDGGSTADGLSYLVMEYIDGMPMTRYCDRHRLKIGDRLRLFQEVCAAVRYAHRNLIVHRDLKPSNILVTPEGQVKLLDFGIAKLLNPDLSGFTLPMTRTELRVMTPEYASPEQVRGETITTASDVYSLGVLLYEILAGHHPYQLAGRAGTQLERVICEQEPAAPSTAVQSSEEVRTEDGTTTVTPESVSLARQTQTERLRRRLGGDLDKIVLMALRKEPDRRYLSVEAFSEDIKRHLTGLPVSAHHPSMRYRTKKFIRRHRVAVAAAVLVLLSLLAGIAGTAWQARVATAGWDRARLESAKAKQVKDFLVGLFEVVDPAVARGEEVTAREMMDRGAEKIEELREQPEVQAEMLHTMGAVYRQLGFYDKAKPMLERSLAMRRTLYGERHEAVAQSVFDLAWLFDDMGDYDRAERLYRESLELRRELLGPRHPDVAASLNDLAIIADKKGAYEESVALYRECLELRREALGEVHLDVAETMLNFGVTLNNQGQYDEAEKLYRQALAMYRRLLGSDEHLVVASSLTNLGSVLHDVGRYDEAEVVLRQGREIRRKLLGTEHPIFGYSSGWLARVLYRRGNYQEAEPLLLEAAAIHREHLGDRHPVTARTLQFLGRLRHETGALAEAARLLAEARSVLRQALPPGHPYLHLAELDLGRVYLDQQRLAEAEPLLLTSHAFFAPEGGEEALRVRQALYDLYIAWGREEQAASFDDPGKAGDSP